MDTTQVLSMRLGRVEVCHHPGDLPPVLFFPGGHCTAGTNCGWDLYLSRGYGLLSFSRPGYGKTDVGRLSPAEFVPAVGEVCQQLGIEQTAAVVGVSFGGLQAIEVSINLASMAPRLVLHSCAPSTYDYPDTLLETLGGAVAFSPRLERWTWRAVSQLVASDTGLRWMVARLSTRPVSQWWETWSDDDRQAARALFGSMRSGAGFATDLRQGRPERAAARHLSQTQVPCPTLVTGSRADAGVAFRHAEDLARTIPRATLVELDSVSHLFWWGPEARQAHDAVAQFLESVD